MQENADKKALNTPGGEALMKSMGGPAGLPFLAFLDDQSTLIVNSFAIGKDGKKSGNIGHPNQPEEVDWFMVMLSKAAPAMTAEERGTIETWLRRQRK